MADVLLSSGYRVVWALLCIVYGVDIVLAAPERISTAVGLAMVGSSILLAMSKTSALGSVMLAFSALVGMAGPATSTMTAFVFWATAALALFAGDDLMTVLRIQVVVVYSFAAVNKFSGAFISGEILSQWMPWWPWPELLAPIVVLTEAVLAIAVWRGWRLALPMIATFHMIMAVVIGDSLRHSIELATYGGMVIWAVYPAHKANYPSFRRSLWLGQGSRSSDEHRPSGQPSIV